MILDKKKTQTEPNQQSIKFALQLLNSNRLVEAKKEINNQITKYPNSSILFNILGAILSEQKQLDKAVEKYEKAIKINPKYAEAYNNLGTTLHKLDRIEEAVDNYKKAINLKDDLAEGYNNLGKADFDFNKLKDSIKYFEKAIKIKPDYVEAYCNLGRTHQDLGNNKIALNYLKKAVQIDPNYAEAYNNLGLTFSDLKNFDESLSSYNKAIKLKPDDEKSYNNLGILLNNLGKFDEATAAYHKAIEIKSDYNKAYSNLLFNLNYKIDFDSNEYLFEAKKYRLNCQPKKKLLLKYQYEKKPKKLKLGLVSADFGNHPGGFFTLNTLRELRKKNFELIAYATANREDEFSHHFKPLFLKWHSVDKTKDEKIVEQIFKDGIHILIDLQGHSAQNRLTIFMYKPAPIQASWLGQGSTGIPEIDYFIGSPHITPQNEEKYYVEKILRLPEISQCFTPPDFDVEINSLPAATNNFITFGCINKLSKINDEVISLWSRILTRIPNAKLILKNKDFDNQKIIQSTFERFGKHQIDKKHLILKGESKTRKELLGVYNEIDIALDPFPFQGNTSTCEAIWMGVPVITLKGDRYLSHFGESINSNLNMHDWIAKDYEDYVLKAVKFSSNLGKLSKIRINLRKTAMQSPVFDASRFAKHFGVMLWNMWKNYNN